MLKIELGIPEVITNLTIWSGILILIQSNAEQMPGVMLLPVKPFKFLWIYSTKRRNIYYKVILKKGILFKTFCAMKGIKDVVAVPLLDIINTNKNY